VIIIIETKLGKFLYILGVILSLYFLFHYLIWSSIQLTELDHYAEEIRAVIFFLSIDLVIVLTGGLLIGINLWKGSNKIKKSVYLIIPFLVLIISVFGLFNLLMHNFSWDPDLEKEISVCYIGLSIFSVIMFWGGVHIVNKDLEEYRS
jgi:hypothetical protein